MIGKQSTSGESLHNGVVPIRYLLLSTEDAIHFFEQDCAAGGRAVVRREDYDKVHPINALVVVREVYGPGEFSFEGIVPRVVEIQLARARQLRPVVEELDGAGD